MQFISALMIVLIAVPLLISLSFMPYFTRETISFGVTVSEEAFRSVSLRRLRKQYSIISLILYAIVLAGSFLTAALKPDVQVEILFAVGATLIVACSGFMNILFHFKMKRLQSSLPEASMKQETLIIDTGFRNRRLILSNRWFILHGLITVLSTIWALFCYDQFPSRIPMHFDLTGEVTRYADKSILTVLFPNIMQLVMVIMFLLINWSILNSKQQIDPGDPADSANRNAIFRRRWSFFNVMSSLMVILLFTFTQLNMTLHFNPDLVLLVSTVVPGIIVLGAMIITFTTGQGGSRIGPRKSPASPVRPYGNDDSWKLGGLYFNPEDPAIFVEKRFGSGWTINLGQIKAWLIIGGFLALIITLAIWAG